MRAALLFLTFIYTSGAVAFDTPARSAIVFDVGTDQTLLEKDADAPLPPASMSKLMTLNMVFEALEDGRLSLSEQVPVSAHAASFGGSTMFLETKHRPTVEELVRGVIVLSGNDASVALGERLSPDGTEAGFARLMTDRARELGMTNSSFSNASGWPAANHRMSMRDLAILADRLITEFPQYYGYFAETEFQFEDSPVANRFNRNPLLKLNIGADGLKTGHTQEAGYGLVGSAAQDGRRIIFVFTGLQSQEQRAKEAERITNWAFNQFVERQLFDKGTVLAEADIWMGEVAKVGLTTKQDIKALIPVLERDGVKAEISYQGPLDAPIAQGAELARLVISVPGFQDAVYPLVATDSVAKGGLTVRMRAAAAVLLRDLADELQERSGLF